MTLGSELVRRRPVATPVGRRAPGFRRCSVFLRGKRVKEGSRGQAQLRPITSCSKQGELLLGFN